MAIIKATVKKENDDKLYVEVDDEMYIVSKGKIINRSATIVEFDEKFIELGEVWRFYPDVLETHPTSENKKDVKDLNE